MAKPLVDDLDRHIGQRIKILRQKVGVSAQALAEGINSSQQQISRYENGHNKLSAAQLYRVACALGVPMAWFFLDYQNPNDDHCLAEPTASYEKARVDEEMAIVSNLWPRMTAEQRTTALRVMDTFLR